MCTTIYYKSPSCKHEWIAIDKPCAKDKNFSNCSDFYNRKVRRVGQDSFIWGEWGQCPEHDKKNEYDGNMLRMVAGKTGGVRLGQGASRRAFNVEFVCCCLM